MLTPYEVMRPSTPALPTPTTIILTITNLSLRRQRQMCIRDRDEDSLDYYDDGEDDEHGYGEREYFY